MAVPRQPVQSNYLRQQQSERMKDSSAGLKNELSVNQALGLLLNTSQSVNDPASVQEDQMPQNIQGNLQNNFEQPQPYDVKYQNNSYHPFEPST